MADIKIAGIMRAGAFSPNHIGNDAAIFNVVAEQLRKRGCEVHIYSEEQFNSDGVNEDIIINMCRELRSIRRLQELEDQGRMVVNSGYGIENCIRERMTRILLGCGIPYPESIIVNTDEGIRDTLTRAGFDRCWIKVGDFHPMHNEDVTYVRQPAEAQEMLQEYFLRGIKRAVINRHLDGDLLKFYGVVGTPFFFWFFDLDPNCNSNNKASAEGRFDAARLKEICEHAAEALDVSIYGGDCIVAPDGSITLIDFNDWPSFAPCRQEAATQIAKKVIRDAKAFREKNK